MKTLPLFPALLAAAFSVAALPAPARAEGILTADNAFTTAVKNGYQDLKDSMNEVFGGYTGNTEKDARIYQERQQKDLEAYRKALHEARETFDRARMEEQGEYLKLHPQLPAPENIEAETHPAPAE